MSTAATTSFVNQVVLDQPKDYNMRLLKKIRAVTVDELKDVLKKVVLPVFDPKTSTVVITTAPVNNDVCDFSHFLFLCFFLDTSGSSISAANTVYLVNI